MAVPKEAPESGWVKESQMLMQVSWGKAKAENFNPERWVSNADGSAQFKARTTTIFDDVAKTRRTEDSPQWVAWFRFHRAEGRKNYESVARSNLYRDQWGQYWPVPAEYPPIGSNDHRAAA